MNMTIETILNFKFDISAFLSIVPTFKNCIEKKKNELLLTIIQKHKKLSTSIPNYNQGEVYRKFIDYAHNGVISSPDKFSKKEIRILSWSLDYMEKNTPYNISIIKSPQYLKSAIDLLETNYRDSVLHPLLLNYLKYWFLQNELIRKFILKHVNNYSGRRKLLATIKNNSEWLLNSRGAVLLAAEFIQKQRRPTTVWEFLELPEYTQSYEYFSEFIVQYTKTMLRNPYTPEQLSEVSDFLKLHKENATDKKVLSKIIVKLGTEAPIDYIDAIKRNILEKIGDPGIESRWYPWTGATETEKQEIENARGIFNEWFTKESIEFFFDKISSTFDPEDFKYRKTFWLAYAKYIEHFRIACGYEIKSSLKRDERFEHLLKSRVADIDGTERGQCAFIFKIKDCIFVEFGKKGAALYVYKNTNNFVPSLDKQYYSIHNLRQPQIMNNLISEKEYTKYYYHEGRLIHRSSSEYYWQGNLKWWLEKELGITPTRSYSINPQDRDRNFKTIKNPLGI